MSPQTPNSCTSPCLATSSVVSTMNDNSTSSSSSSSSLKTVVKVHQTHAPPATASATATTTATSTEKNAIPLATRLVLSALAGMGGATVCHPLDVIRVQMQTSAHYRSSYQAAVGIYRQAGFLNGLYAGISAAYLRQLMYGSCRMGIYAYLLDHAKTANVAAGRNAMDISFPTKLAMGAVAGGIGSLVGTPSELALVRMSGDSKLPLAERRNYKNVIDALVRITRQEGAMNLWRGATPTVARATLLGSFQMGVTSECKGRLVDSGYFGENGQWLGGYPMMMCATLVASLAANLAANPFDVIKSRMQNMPINADGTAMYKGMVDCAVTSIRAEGPMVLYAGFFPAFVKLAPYTIISLTLADKLTKAVTGKDAL